METVPRHASAPLDRARNSGVDPDAFPLDQLMALTLATLHVAPEADDEPVWRRILVPQKTRNDLQWDALLELLAEGAVSPEGKALTRAIAPLREVAAVRRRLREISEGQALAQADDRPPLRGLSDIRIALAHVKRGGSLIGEDLVAIARNCDVASRCVRFYTHRAEQVPYLADAARPLDPCESLRQTLTIAVEPDGTLSDRASADLARLRRTVQQQHERIRAYIDRMLRDEEMEERLQGDYFTLREDRYVLPVRRSNKGQVPGIVHGYSSTGQTAYIEPNAMIELNNQLRWAQIELQEEEERILKRLSEQVARDGAALARNSEVLAYLDLLNACAQLAARLDASTPTLTDGEVDLQAARHPLLYLKDLRVDESGQRQSQTIPNDIQLDAQKRALIISGPNTGGKTVLLKTFGLCALMVRCGLPIPAGEESKLPLFRGIFTDIGDEQSIDRDLSTFSGHLMNINQFIDDCGDQSLVLLDELFNGTDPMQGAALGVALLEELTARGARTVVTTHLEDLKTLAFQRDSYANASMGFNLETLAPTYRVTYGLPGGSYAVRIAERLGFPQVILDRARRILDGLEMQSVEEILGRLEDRRADMEREQRKLEQSRREAEDARRRYRDKYDRLLAREKELVHDQTRKLKGELDEARALIRERIKALQREGQPEVKERLSSRDLERLRDELVPAGEVIERARDFVTPVEMGPSGLAPVASEDLHDGLEVYVHTFKRKAVVVGDQRGATDVQLQVGAMKIKAKLADLYFPSEAARRANLRGTPQLAAPPSAIQSEPQLLPQTSGNSVDLRGMRVDEALEKLELFLDAAYRSNITGVYVIHGHGTGALRRAARAELPASPHVLSWRRGDRTEGGDGVTVVFLKPD